MARPHFLLFALCLVAFSGSAQAGVWEECREEAGLPEAGWTGRLFNSIDPDRAIAACERSLVQTPADGASLARLARALSRAGRKAEAFARLLPFADRDDPDILAYLATFYRDGDGGAPQDSDKAIALFERAEALGSGFAAHCLYLIYSDEKGPVHDTALAEDHLARAASMSYPYSLTRLGRRLLNSDLVADQEKAVAMFGMASDAGEPDAAYLLGLASERGKGTDRNAAKAIEWYRLETDRFQTGSTVAYAWLRMATLLRAGADGVEIDASLAREAFQKASDLDVADATWALGDMARKGEGQEIDERLALSFFRKAEKQGDAFSAVEIGKAYVQGRGTVGDYVEAALWFERATQVLNKNGLAIALHNLSLRYSVGFDGEINKPEAQRLLSLASTGTGTEFDLELGRLLYTDPDPEIAQRGIDLIRQVAEKDDSSAHLALGYAYANGHGVELNYETAATWYQKAANLENAIAARNLGELHENGMLGEADPLTAIQWYRKAADKNSFARQRLAVLLADSSVASEQLEALDYLLTGAEKLYPDAIAVLGTAIDQASHPLHALVHADENAARAKDAALSIGISFEEPVSGCLAIANGCGSSDRRVDIARAAEWFRRASPLPLADFRLARLLTAHPALALSAGEMETALTRASKAGLPEARLLYGLMMADGTAPEAVFAEEVAALAPVKAITLAQFAAIARFGDALIAPGWSYLRDRSLGGDQAATSAFVQVQLFYGAFNVASETLAGMPTDVTLDLEGADYTLEQMLSLWLVEVRRGFEPDPRQLASLRSLLPTLAERGVKRASDLSIMLEEVEYRLAEQKQADGVHATLPDIGVGRSLSDRLADISATIEGYEKSGGLAPPVVSLHRKRAELLYQDGQPDKATDALLQATATALEINNLTRHLSGSLIFHMERACVLRKTSQAFYQMKMPQKGLAFAKGAVDALQDARRATLGLPQDMQSCFRDAIADQYRTLAGMMIEAGQLDEAQATLAQLADFEAYQFWQDDAEVAGDAFAEIVKRPAEHAMVTRVAGLGLAELGALRADLEQAKIDGNDALIGEIQARLEAAQEALAESLDELGDVLDERAAAEEGAAADLVDELASEMSARALRRLQGRLERLPGLASVYSLTLPERTHFLIVTDQGTEHIALDMPAPKLAKAVASLRDSLQGLSAQVPLDQQQLFYADVWARVEEVLRQSSSTDVLLTLDAPLRRVPIAALHDGEQWLLEKRNYVTFMPAGKDLLLDDSPIAMDAVQALGAANGGAGFSSLPNVASELRSIVRDEATGVGIVPGKIRLNAEFDETGFADALSAGAPVVHIASHFDLRDRDDRSVLLLGTGETLSMADLKSGLRKGRFDVSKVDLLVLSACQTALDGSAGLESFASAMHAEGVRTVLATLWPVPDRSTALFMQRYYQHLTAGERRVDALRLTQIEFLKLDEVQLQDLLSRGAAPLDGEEMPPQISSLSHPRAWAGFQLIGQWR